MSSDQLLKKIIVDNYTKSAALAALGNYTNQVNQALFKDKDAAEFEGLNRDNAKEILDKVKKDIENREPLFITLGAQLPDDKLADLGSKIRQMFGKEFLVEFTVNTALLAGIQLVYKGRMLDLSMKNKIDNARLEILEICKKYLSS